MNSDTIFFDSKPITTLVFCRSADSISTKLDGETVILDISRGIYSNLEPVGTTIWDYLSQPRTFIQIVKHVTTLYDVDDKQCSLDLISFLKELRDNGLVVVTVNEET